MVVIGSVYCIIDKRISSSGLPLGQVKKNHEQVHLCLCFITDNMNGNVYVDDIDIYEDPDDNQIIK